MSTVGGTFEPAGFITMRSGLPDEKILSIVSRPVFLTKSLRTIIDM